MKINWYYVINLIWATACWGSIVKSLEGDRCLYLTSCFCEKSVQKDNSDPYFQSKKVVKITQQKDKLTNTLVLFTTYIMLFLLEKISSK